jgi:hypothetical protein
MDTGTLAVQICWYHCSFDWFRIIYRAKRHPSFLCMPQSRDRDLCSDAGYINISFSCLPRIPWKIWRMDPSFNI